MTQDLRSLIGRIQKSSIALMSTATEIAATSRQQEGLVADYGTSTNYGSQAPAPPDPSAGSGTTAQTPVLPVACA